MVWSCRLISPVTGRSGPMLKSHHKLALFMEGALGLSEGKMGYGLLRYSPNEIVAASNVSSPNGRRMPSPATKSWVG